MVRNNNAKKFAELREKHPEFVYKTASYNISNEGLEINFEFLVDEFEFTPRLLIPSQPFIDFHALSSTFLHQLVFNIGMVELISYWKAICPQKLIIKPYKLDASQIDFWKKIYFHGLGEFFYLNSIETSQEDFMVIVSDSHAPALKPVVVAVNDISLIPVGGGKDSVVSLEILKHNSDNIALIMNPRGASTATANIAGFEHRTLVVKRFLDKRLLDLNDQGYLNGHTPFSALLAFVTVLAAGLSKSKYIALSNESSANESTVVGTMVNHQYSKSLEFETDFRNYIQRNITPSIQYYSLLRPLSELQIASVFAQNSDYFMDFKSCNAGSKTNSWCGKCSKCLFTFIILSPFISPKVLVDIYGCNLLENNDLLKYFRELTGLDDVKPFECVGTVDEVNAALQMAMDFYPNSKPALLQYYLDNHAGTLPAINRHELLTKMEQDHFVEDRFMELIKAKLLK